MSDTPAPESAPDDFESLRTAIIARRETLPKRLAQAAEFAVQQPDEVALGTAASVAEQAMVQPSTLVRLAQAFGYSGFSEFQAVFRTHLRSRWPDYQERLKVLSHRGEGERGVIGLLEGCVEASVASLAAVNDRLREQDLEQAARILSGAETVCLIGMRRAFPVVAYMSYVLAKLGVRSILVDNVAMLAREQSGLASASDALISVSFTPYTPLTVEITQTLHAAGVPVVAMTDSPFSPLAPNADVTLEIVESDFSGFRSLSAAMCLAQALAIAIAQARSARDRHQPGGPREPRGPRIRSTGDRRR